MGNRWSAIPDRETTVDDESWVLVSEEEARHLIDERELFLLLQAVEEISGGTMSVITTDTFVEDGNEETVWAIIADIYSDAAFDANVAWGASIIDTLKELIKAMHNADTAYEDMDPEQIDYEVRTVRATLEQGYTAWRHDTTDPSLEVVELWEFPSECKAPVVIGIGRGEDRTEALRNLLVGLRDRDDD